jgi:Ca2+-binding RTX toxin-like protein
MVLQISATNSIGTGLRLDLTTVDSAFVTHSVTVASTDSVAIRGTGSKSGADTLIGSTAANVLSGLGGADALRGGGGADRLLGGAGSDTLTGGAGGDTFQFNALTDAGDIILDFSNAAGNNDQFRISAAGFGGGLVVGVLAAGQFQARADTLAQDADDRFIFRTTDATLWFDVNGNLAGGLTQIADLQAGAVVTAEISCCSRAGGRCGQPATVRKSGAGVRGRSAVRCPPPPDRPRSPPTPNAPRCLRQN